MRLSRLVMLCLMAASPALPARPTMTQTQTQLKQLDRQINTLQHTLASEHNRQAVLNKELAHTEKEIGEGVRKLRSIQNTMQIKERTIQQLQDKVSRLNHDLSTQQNLLASHVRARYHMGEYQPLKWVLNQDSPQRINRILTYYQYFVHSRQTLIAQIDTTRKNINDNKEALHQELVATLLLKNKLTQHQQQLMHNKTYQSTLVQTVRLTIQNKQQHLADAQKNKQNLYALLQSLSQKSVVQTKAPFGVMRKKLPYPVPSTHVSLQRMHQGLTFFADEGTVVTAVYPGKIVFSDWLKGYGLLLIIDHGQGFMTLYAHNQSLFKHKGQTVRQHDQIATVGHTGGIQENALYFEIRVKGKAVPPLGWLA